MRTPPADLSDSQVRAAVAEHWPIAAATVTYAPVGFGGHHWVLAEPNGNRWFITADATAVDLQQAGKLRAALTTAYALRHDGNLPFVVAAIPGHHGRLVASTGRYTIAVHRYLPSVDSPPTAEQRLGMLTKLHAATDQLGHLAPVDDLTIPYREDVEALLNQAAPPNRNDAGAPPTTRTPYRGRLARLLHRHRGPLETAFHLYDELSAAVTTGRDMWVITHGEPKANNTLSTSRGPVLVDWDTLRLAPAARDLWMIPKPDKYTRITGRRLPDSELQLYRLGWDLKDLTHYTHWLTNELSVTADTEHAWRGCLHICRRLPER
jgi:hypothetical protein